MWGRGKKLGFGARSPGFESQLFEIVMGGKEDISSVGGAGRGR